MVVATSAVQRVLVKRLRLSSGMVEPRAPIAGLGFVELVELFSLFCPSWVRGAV